jgi:hypothetical protein
MCNCSQEPRAHWGLHHGAETCRSFPNNNSQMALYVINANGIFKTQILELLKILKTTELISCTSWYTTQPQWFYTRSALCFCNCNYFVCWSLSDLKLFIFPSVRQVTVYNPITALQLGITIHKHVVILLFCLVNYCEDEGIRPKHLGGLPYIFIFIVSNYSADLGVYDE